MMLKQLMCMIHLVWSLAAQSFRVSQIQENKATGYLLYIMWRFQPHPQKQLLALTAVCSSPYNCSCQGVNPLTEGLLFTLIKTNKQRVQD